MIKNLALEASAGSGKTYALSVRYISLLFLGVHPNVILTLTFTNKTAIEMKKRIFETLKNLEYSSELNEIIATTNKTRDEILRLKPEIFKEFLQSDLKISTIDSFFSSILRKFSFNIGVMPDFQLEESVISDDKIKRFLKICKSEMLYKSLILFALNEDKKLDDIFSLMGNLFEKHSEINFDNLASNSVGYPKEKEILAIIKEIKQQFLKNGLGERGLNTLEVINVKNLLQKKFLQRNDLNYWSYNKYCSESINALFGELKVKLYEFCRAKERYILSEIAKLYKAFTQALSVESKRNSTLSFLEMVNKLYDILRDDIARDFLYFRMDGNFSHLLVDEFQDTNIVQYKILEPFFQEIVSGVGAREKRSLFLVGDVKQSIYRFRGGAKEIFSYAVNSLGLELGILGTNHRSSSSIVDFVNDTFEDKIQDYKRQMTKMQNVKGFAGVYIDDDLQKNLISQIKYLLKLGVKCNDIAVLCYTNKEALLLKEWIEDEIKNIQVTMEAKRKLINIPVISAIIDFVCYLYFKDKLYLKNFQAISGKTYKKDDYSFDINENVDTLIIKIIRYFDIFYLEDDYLLFIEVCAKFRDIEDFLFNFPSISQNSISQENSAIRVLTIHKSKGLEFSNVFVIDRLKRSRSGGNTFIFDYVDIQLEGIYLNIKNREFFDSDYAKAKAKEKLKESEDAINTQYVAFTRAKDNLFILAKEKDSTFQNLELKNTRNGEIYIKKDEEQIKYEEPVCFMPKRFGVQESEKKEADTIKIDDFRYRDFGLALHYMLEMMGGFNKKYIKNSYESLCNKYKMILDIDNLEDIKKRVIRLLDDTRFQTIIKDAKIMKEQPIYYDGQRKQLDLLLEFEDKVIVVDYKSSEFLQSSHVKQVSLYKKALSEIYNKNCDAYICYLKQEKNEMIKV